VLLTNKISTRILEFISFYMRQFTDTNLEPMMVMLLSKQFLLKRANYFTVWKCWR